MAQELMAAEIILRGPEGSSILDFPELPGEEELASARPTTEARREASARLMEWGFTISSEGEFGLTAVGSRRLFERTFRTRVKPAGESGSFFLFAKPPTVPTNLRRWVAAVELAPPHDLHF